MKGLLLSLVRKPFHLFLLFGLVCVMVIPFSRSVVMDLHYHDTYIVVNGYMLPLISLVFSLFIWLIGASLGRHLQSRRLTWIHLILTVILLMFLALSPFIYDNVWGSGLAGVPRRYYSYWTMERYGNPQYFGELLVIAFVFAIITQGLLVMNLSLGYFRKD